MQIKHESAYMYPDQPHPHEMMQLSQEKANARTGQEKPRSAHQSALKSEERTSEDECFEEGAFMLEEEEEDEEEKDSFKKPKRRRRSKWTDNS